MRTLFIVVLLFQFRSSFAQPKITEKKDEKGQLVEYVVETPLIFTSLREGVSRFSFIWSIQERRRYLKVTIPEIVYRRINTNDSVQIFFDDNSILIMNVVKDQKGYVLTEKWDRFVSQYYLPFIVDLNDKLLDKLSKHAVKKLYFKCKGYTANMSDDFSSFEYPISRAEKRRFHEKALIDHIFSRQKINKKGVQDIQSAAENFSKYIKSLSP